MSRREEQLTCTAKDFSTNLLNSKIRQHGSSKSDRVTEYVRTYLDQAIQASRAKKNDKEAEKRELFIREMINKRSKKVAPVAEELNMNVRKAQRWWKDFKESARSQKKHVGYHVFKSKNHFSPSPPRDMDSESWLEKVLELSPGEQVSSKTKSRDLDEKKLVEICKRIKHLSQEYKLIKENSILHPRLGELKFEIHKKEEKVLSIALKLDPHIAHLLEKKMLNYCPDEELIDFALSAFGLHIVD